MFKSIGPTELIIIAVVLLVLFGGKKIPEFFRGLVESIKEFKKSSNETDGDKKADN